MRTVTAIRHVPFEDLGSLRPMFAARGATCDEIDAPVADLDAFDPLAPDLLVVLGGPIGVYEERAYPFLSAELRLIERRLAADRPLLGICLGAQLIARALGARVYPGSRKEIGWSPIALTERGAESPLRHLARADVLHWHGDTFDVPADTVLLASTQWYPHQAFSRGNALALQFHVEVAALEPWLVGHAVELAGAGIDPAVLRATALRSLPPLRAAAEAFLDAWLRAQSGALTTVQAPSPAGSR